MVFPAPGRTVSVLELWFICFTVTDAVSVSAATYILAAVSSVTEKPPPDVLPKITLSVDRAAVLAVAVRILKRLAPEETKLVMDVAKLETRICLILPPTFAQILSEEATVVTLVAFTNLFSAKLIILVASPLMGCRSRYLS